MTNRVSTFLFSATTVAVLGLVGVGTSQAQITDGQVVGTVFDATQSVVPNADVEIVNVATNVKSTTKTNASGEYRFNNLPAGQYDLKTTHAGFSASTIHGIQVSLGKTATSNVTLAVGETSTTIEVAESATLIDTTTAQVGATFGEREAIDSPASSLPLGALNLSLLAAGVANAGGLGLGDGPSVGGQRPRNNSFIVEGVDNNRRDVTGRNVTVPNEAVSEFTLLQNQYSAEFGSGTGGQFITSIRGGSNTFHGTAFEYLQNRNFNAVDQMNARQGFLTNPRYDQNTFGGSLGGPIKKDKLFFYGLWQYNPTGTASAPTSSPINSPTAAGYATLNAMPGLSQTNLGVLKQYLAPAPTASGSVTVNGVDIPTGILPISAPSYLNIETYLVSLDYNPTNRDQLRGRFVNEIHTGFDPSTLAPLPAFFVGRDTTSKLLSFSEIHNFTANLLNEFRFGYDRYNDSIPAGNFQYPGLDTFPNITIDDLNSTQLGPYNGAPQFTVLNTYQLIDNVSLTKGRHTMKFGWEGRKYITNTTFIQRVRGDYDYDTLDNFLTDVSPPFAERNVGGAVYSGNAINQGLFATDAYRVRPNVTISIGLRWDYQGIPASDKLQALNAISSLPGVIEFGVPKAQKTAFSPHIGIAYSPGKSGKTSIRMGFAQTYDKIFENDGILSLPPQLTSTVDVQPGQANFLANGGILPSAPGQAACSTAADCRSITSAYIPDQKLPYALTWNFGIQHVFGNDYTLEVRYLGDRGVHQFVQQRLNILDVVNPTNFIPTYLTPPSAATLAALPKTLDQVASTGTNFSPLYPGFDSNLFALENIGNSSYHGLAVEFTRRFARNLLFKASYTWSHNIDDSTADLFSTLLSPRRPQDFQNLTNEKSDSFLDRRHRLTYNWVYDLPWYTHSNNRLARYVLGGFILSGTYTFESPQHATVQSNIDSNLNGDSAADRVIVNTNGVPGIGSGVYGLTATGQRVTPDSSVTADTGPIVAYVAENPNAQYITAGLGALANGGRQTLALGRIDNLDVQVKKAIGISERVKLEFAVQFFNVLNHAQYTPGYTNYVQFHDSMTTRDNLVPDNPAFNRPDLEYNSNSRITQLTARLHF